MRGISGQIVGDCHVFVVVFSPRGNLAKLRVGRLLRAEVKRLEAAEQARMSKAGSTVDLRET